MAIGWAPVSTQGGAITMGRVSTSARTSSYDAAPEPAQVDDAANPGCPGGISEVLRRRPVKRLEPGRGLHRVDEVERGVDALHRTAKRHRIHDVAGDHLGVATGARRERLGPAG